MAVTELELLEDHHRFWELAEKGLRQAFRDKYGCEVENYPPIDYAALISQSIASP